MDTTRMESSLGQPASNATMIRPDMDPENYLLMRLTMKDLGGDLDSAEFSEVGAAAKDACRTLASKAASVVASHSALKMSVTAEDDHSIELAIDRKGAPKCLYISVAQDGIHVQIFFVNGPEVIKKKIKAAYAPVDKILDWLLV